VLGLDWEESLATLGTLSPRPPTVAVGPSSDPQILRRAMQAGVRDYIGAPFTPEEIVESVTRIAREQAPMAADPQSLGRLFAVINVKGGSGASFIAANLAHIVATQRKIEVGLLDLDLQFGALPLAFDLEQRSTLLEALTTTSQIDPTALRGYMARHDSGVCVLSAMSEQLVLPWEVSRDALLRLLRVMRATFPVVIVDLPRQIDPLTTAVIEQADRVLMIMQQSLAHARDAKRMQRVLSTTVGVPRDRLMLIINRHSDKQSVRGRDVQDAVNPSSMTVLPNDFATVSEALNIGVPVYDYDREATNTQAMEDLVGRLGLPAVVGAVKHGGGWRELLAHPLRK
jgi:pilus assembly protein CpaE